jgi:hypothetical protein
MGLEVEDPGLILALFILLVAVEAAILRSLLTLRLLLPRQ